MKALGYEKAHSLAEFQVREIMVPTPEIKEQDLLVRVKAISLNPIDYKVRSSRHGEAGKPVVLGWDVAGIVEKIGSRVKGFAPGDEVYYAGDLTRPGGNAELHAVDARIVGKKPASLSFAQAAALPLTALTAWEALFDKAATPKSGKAKVLVVAGAGGVGSIAVQILKAVTDAVVVTTASRPETAAFAREMGADVVIDHDKDFKGQLAAADIQDVDVFFSTTHSAYYLPVAAEVLRPFGHFVLIDDLTAPLDVNPLKRKAISFHWELMFTKSLYGYRMESQAEILNEVARLVDQGKMKSTMTNHLKGLTAENLRQAHALQESGKSIGKLVIEL